MTNSQLKAIFKKHLSWINKGLERVKYHICYHSNIGLTSFSDMALIKTRETNSLQLESHFIFAVNSVPLTINKLHLIKNKCKPVTNKDQGWTNCSKFYVFLKNIYFMITVVHDSNLNAKHPIVIKYKLNWNNPQPQLNVVFSTPCFSLTGHLQVIPNLHEILGRI